MSNNNDLLEEGALPLYYQLIRIIKRDITEGSLKPGDKIPSEQELCEKYKVSRITVRQALLSLVNEGLLYRKQGKGTFIAKPKLPRRINNLYNFSTSMKALKIIPTSKVIEQSIVSATDDLNKKLNLKDPEGKVIKLTRTRLADGDPIMVETSYIPYNIAPSLINEDMEHNSIYSLLSEKYKLHITEADETYEAIVIDEKEAKLLNCTPFSPGFFIERIAFLDNGTPAEYSNSIVCADRCKLVTKLREKHTTFERKIDPFTKMAE